MVNLRGGYHQPITVVLFDQNNQNERPIVHNVVCYISPDSRLLVMDPNDAAHQVRSGTFNGWQLTYSISNGAQLVRQVWNNVFFTREYANRVGGGRPGKLDVALDECAGELLWENENFPDEEWFGEMPLISFNPDYLSTSCPGEY